MKKKSASSQCESRFKELLRDNIDSVTICSVQVFVGFIVVMLWYGWMTEFADFGFIPKYRRVDNQYGLIDEETVEKYHDILSDCKVDKDCELQLIPGSYIRELVPKCVKEKCLFKPKKHPKYLL